MEIFKQKFIEDSNNLLVNLESNLLELEKDRENKQIIEEIFRVMHTLKGVSAMFGFEIIGEYTHDMESIYDLIRNGNLIVSDDIFDVTFQSVDHIRNLLQDEKLTIESNKSNHDSLLKKIASIVKNTDKKETKIVVETPKTKTIKTYYILFHPREEIVTQGLNLLNIFKDLATLGPIHIVEHHDIEIEKTKHISKFNWGIYLATDRELHEVSDVFFFMPDDFRIVKISDTNLFNQDEFIEILDKTKIVQPIKKEDIEPIKTKEEDFIINFFDEKDKIKFLKQKPENKKTKENILQEIKTQKQNCEKEEQKTEPIQIHASQIISSRISVESEKLDTLMYLVSELVITKAELNLITEKQDYERLPITSEKIDKLAKQFRDITLEIRLVPISEMIIKFKRLIRDLSKGLSKEIEFLSEGAETELDKNVLDRLADPIMHIIRNSIDHGIEDPEVRILFGKPSKGTIKIKAYHSGQNVFLEISDDGKGIDKEKIVQKAKDKGLIQQQDNLSDKEIFDLIFLPGFSTAQSLTEISGRGVGMDVVRRTIAELRGEIEVKSETNVGTNIIIKLPLSLAILDAMLVRIANMYCLIPLDVIHSCAEAKTIELKSLPNKQLPFEEDLIPFILLRDEFQINDESPEIQRVIFIKHDQKRIALIVDQVVGEHQAVLKPLGQMFKKIDFVSGASILGSGDIALVLDTNKLISHIY